MTSQHKLLLCAYNRAGFEVMQLVSADSRISDVALYTHESGPVGPDLQRAAGDLGIWSTAGRIGVVPPPFEPDVVALVYYRHIVSASVINAVSGRIFNVHPSLLPRHRGCSSIPWAILDGDDVTGVTYHYVEPTVDTGRVITQAALQIAADETQGKLYERSMSLAVQLWPAALTLVLDEFPGLPQEGEACYHQRGAPHSGEIDDSWSDGYISRFIRAMDYPPYPYARYQGHEVRTFDEYKELRRMLG